MKYPTREDITKALRALLRRHGKLSADTACSLLADWFSLSDAQRTMTRDEYYGDGSSGSLWSNLVQWARADLRALGELSLSPRGVWELSDAGRISADIDALIAEAHEKSSL